MRILSVLAALIILFSAIDVKAQEQPFGNKNVVAAFHTLLSTDSGFRMLLLDTNTTKLSYPNYPKEGRIAFQNNIHYRYVNGKFVQMGSDLAKTYVDSLITALGVTTIQKIRWDSAYIIANQAKIVDSSIYSTVRRLRDTATVLRGAILANTFDTTKLNLINRFAQKIDTGSLRNTFARKIDTGTLSVVAKTGSYKNLIDTPNRPTLQTTLNLGDSARTTNAKIVLGRNQNGISSGLGNYGQFDLTAYKDMNFTSGNYSQILSNYIFGFKATAGILGNTAQQNYIWMYPYSAVGGQNLEIGNGSSKISLLFDNQGGSPQNTYALWPTLSGKLTTEENVADIYSTKAATQSGLDDKVNLVTTEGTQPSPNIQRVILPNSTTGRFPVCTAPTQIWIGPPGDSIIDSRGDQKTQLNIGTPYAMAGENAAAFSIHALGAGINGVLWNFYGDNKKVYVQEVSSSNYGEGNSRQRGRSYHNQFKEIPGILNQGIVRNNVNRGTDSINFLSRTPTYFADSNTRLDEVQNNGGWKSYTGAHGDFHYTGADYRSSIVTSSNFVIIVDTNTYIYSGSGGICTLPDPTVSFNNNREHLVFNNGVGILTFSRTVFYDSTTSTTTLSNMSPANWLRIKCINGKWIAIQRAAATTASGVTSVNTRTGDVVLSKTDVGLGNVDNTSDANKPVSTAQQTALNTKQNTVSLTTTGTSGAATFNASTGALNIPNYATGGGGSTSPAGSNGQIQFNNSGVFGASANLNWDNTNSYLGIGAVPTVAKLQVNAGNMSGLYVENVGSGTTPVATFKNTSSSGYASIDLFGGSGITNATKFQFGQYPSGTAYFFQNGAYPIEFSTNSLKRLTVDYLGNLGLGTATPTQRFDLVDGLTTIRLGSGNIAQTPTLNMLSSGGKAAALYAGVNYTGFNFSNDGYFVIGTESRANFTNNIVASGVDVPIMRVNANGSVGIGNTGSSKLDVAGSFGTAIRSVTANTTATIDDATILVDASAGPVTVTLTVVDRRQYRVLKIDASTNAVTVVPSAGTFNGASSKVFTTKDVGGMFHCLNSSNTYFFSN